MALKWDKRYRLASVTLSNAVERYGYDALDRRISISDGATTNYLVYAGVHVVAEIGTSGSLVRSYTYGPGIDNILSVTVHGGTMQTYYYVKDHLGSVLALTDSSGTIVESYRYDAWGNTSVFDGSGNPIQASAIGNRYCWQGREISWKTGLYFFRARWYDPVTGRWLSNDPIGISGGLNQYVFCANNPVNRRDPSGLCREKIKEWWEKWREWWEFVIKALVEGLTHSPPLDAVHRDMTNIYGIGHYQNRTIDFKKDPFNTPVPDNAGW